MEPCKRRKKAYNKAAATQKIELIEMNSQFNVKHNLANYAEQQVFNSTGQIHLSPATKEKLSNFYADYKLQPTYMMANSGDLDVSAMISNVDASTQCGDGMTRVSDLISETQTCVDKSIAKQWSDMSVKGLVFLDDDGGLGKTSSVSDVKTNPGTNCKEGHTVIYDVLTSEYKCVLKSAAEDLVDANTAEIHTLTEYVLGKDKQKIVEDRIYEINQKIQNVTEEYDVKRKTLDSKYDDSLEIENSLAKQAMQEIIKEYKTNSEITKEDVTKRISEIMDANNSIKEKILKEKSNALSELELQLKNKILKIVKGYENNPAIDVDWIYLNDDHDDILVSEKEAENSSSETSLLEQNIDKIHLENVSIVNSFGQKFDEIKSNQILQVSADIINPDEYTRDFVYAVEITDSDNVLVQPAKWMAGTLNPNQTLNVEFVVDSRRRWSV